MSPRFLLATVAVVLAVCILVFSHAFLLPCAVIFCAVAVLVP